MTSKPRSTRDETHSRKERNPDDADLSTEGDHASSASSDDASLPTELQILFGENLRKARLKCGLTQNELSKRAGLGVSYVSKVELGQKNLTLRTMQKLAEIVDHDVVHLLNKPPS